MPEDVARQETNRADNERQHAWNQRRRVRRTSQAVVRAQGEETLSELGSLGADEEEGEDEEQWEIIFSSHSPFPESLPLPDDLFR
jgi:hypothetical protein